LHHADHMAARIEYEMWASDTTVTPKPKSSPTIEMSQERKDDLMNVFNNLFS